jgi:sensor histidine kinase YesM
MTVFQLLLIPLIVTFQSIVFNNVENTDTIHTHQKAIVVNISDTARLDTIAAMAKKYSDNSTTFELANTLIDSGFNLAKEKGLDVPYNLYWANATLLFARKDYEYAYKQMEKACKLLKSTDHYQEIVEAHILLARLLLFLGYFSDAIDMNNWTIDFAREKNLTSVVPLSYRCLADIYQTLNNTEESRKYTQLMLDESLRENNIEMTAQGYQRLGRISVLNDSNYFQSIQYYKKCLAIRQQQNDSVRIADLLGRLGWSFYMAKQNDSSLAYFNRSLDYGIPLSNYNIIANSYGNIGTIYSDENEYKKALENYQKSIDYSYKVSDWYNLSWLYEDMSKMYKSMGDYRNAYEHFVLHKNFSDSLRDQKYDIGLAQAREKFQADTKAKDLELLSLKYDQQKYLVYGFAGLMVLALVIGFLIFRQVRINAKRRISEMNHKISEITQANLRQQMNPHFIFNTLNSIQYYMYQHDKIATNNYLTKFSSLIRKTLENSQHPAIPIKDELDALQLYLELETLRFKDKFTYSIEIDDDIDTLLYRIPTMLVQPYVENAIGHGLMNKDGNGHLKIDFRLYKNYIGCTIEDDGIGRQAAMEIRNSKNGNHRSLGTKITESRLTLANAIYGTSMKVEYTDLKDSDGKPAGTRVEIHIPIITW